LWLAVAATLVCPGIHALAEDVAGGDPPAAVSLESLTVTAEKITEYIRNHPQEVTEVGRKEILQRNFLSVEETLNSMPGVEVLPASGIGSRISIRGSGKTGGVLVLLNGRPLNSSQYGGVDLSTIPIDIVKSVTVFKPPVPVWLGPGASEGAISILTHDFKATPDQKEKRISRIRMSAGSFGAADIHVSHSAPLSIGTLMLTAAGSRQDGRRTNSDRDKGDFSLHWDRRLENMTRLELNGRYYLSVHGSPGPTDNPTPDARQRYEKTSLDFKSQGLLGSSGDYVLNAYTDSVNLKDESESGFTSRLRDFKLGLKADANRCDANDIWALRIGAILEREAVDHTLSGDHDRVTAGGHAQYDRHFGPLSATVGLRGDYTNDFDLNPAVTGGLSFAATKRLLIKGNAGYRVSVPSFGQLYQPSHGSIDQVRGNPDLKEEKVRSYDMAAEYRLRKDRVLQASLFRVETGELIVYRRGADLVYQPVNIDQAFRHGVELTAKYAWDRGVSVDLDLIFQDSENRDTGKALAYTPRSTVKATVRYVLPKRKTRLETSLRYVGSRYSESEGLESEKLSDYTTVDLKVLQPFTAWHRRWEAYLNLYNLFDRDFESHYGYPDDGLRFTAGLNLTL
jgi:vitamin B12 transporter